MVAKVIVNPYAGRWLALNRLPEVETALKSAGLDYEIAITEGPGHGIELAKQATQQGFRPIISAGGDGSISEVVNGVALAAGLGETQNKPKDIPPLGIIPLGSANDLVDNLGLPKDLNLASEAIAKGKVKWIDLGVVIILDGETWRTRFFDNNAAIGLEPYITLIQQRIHRVRGDIRYLLATLLGIRDNPKWQVQMEWEGGNFEGLITLVTVGNCPRTGGLFYMTPHANPSDGQLTFVYGYMPTRLKILTLLPKTMKSGEGSYVEHPSIHEIHSSWLRIHSLQPTPAHADGEIFSNVVHDLEYRILPRVLPILSA